MSVHEMSIIICEIFCDYRADWHSENHNSRTGLNEFLTSVTRRLSGLLFSREWAQERAYFPMVVNKTTFLRTMIP